LLSSRLPTSDGNKLMSVEQKASHKMTENRDGDDRSLSRREKVLVSAVVLASVVGVVGGAALGLTFLSSNPEKTVPGTAPTTTPVAPLAGTAGDASNASLVASDDFEYRGEYDQTQDRPDWAEPKGIGLYTGGAYSVEVSSVDSDGNVVDSLEMDPVMYLTYGEDDGETMTLEGPDGELGSLDVSGASELRIDVKRSEEDSSARIRLGEKDGSEVWLGGTVESPHYLTSE